MIAAHTPGPWKIRAGFDSDMKEIYAPNPKIKKPFIPTQLADVRADCKEGKANARLVAAAPELLDLLEQALTYTSCPSWSPSLTKEIESLIAKATGATQ